MLRQTLETTNIKISMLYSIAENKLINQINKLFLANASDSRSALLNINIIPISIDQKLSFE